MNKTPFYKLANVYFFELSEKFVEKRKSIKSFCCIATQYTYKNMRKHSQQ